MKSSCAILSSVVCRLYNTFPHYLRKCTIVGKKKVLKKKCVFWFSLQLLSETFLILRRTERDVYTLLCKVSAILVGFHETSIFSTDFRKTLKCKISWNIRPVGSWVVPCGQKDRHDEINICFFSIFWTLLKSRANKNKATELALYSTNKYYLQRVGLLFVIS